MSNFDSSPDLCAINDVGICRFWEYVCSKNTDYYVLLHNTAWGLSPTRDKNEGIYLWLLEQDRQKNRAQALKQTDLNPAVQSQNTSSNSGFNSEEFQTQIEKKPSSYSESTDFEQLIKEKASLEEEYHRLDEEQQKLNLRIKMLCEETIREMKKKNGEKQQIVNQLQARISGLEDKLDKLVMRKFQPDELL